jgi:integrase
MPKVPADAILQTKDSQTVMAEATKRGPMVRALLAWLYEFGARASEPGLQTLDDVDLRGGRARPRHLKDGEAPKWRELWPHCLAALPPWLEARPSFIKHPQQRNVLFPSQSPGKCYACHGTGQRRLLRRDKATGKRFQGEAVDCHHCAATGKRWGISRIEVYGIVHEVLQAAGLPESFCFPHVLRHSLITHLIESSLPVTKVQARVGHRSLQTTLNYAKSTEPTDEEMEKIKKRIYE